MITIDAETLARFVGVLLSLVMAYVPGVEAWYAAGDNKVKSLVMGALIVIVGVAIFLGGCFKFIATNVACDTVGIIALVQILIATLVANQATYLIAVRSFKK